MVCGIIRNKFRNPWRMCWGILGADGGIARMDDGGVRLE